MTGPVLRIVEQPAWISVPVGFGDSAYPDAATWAQAVSEGAASGEPAPGEPTLAEVLAGLPELVEEGEDVRSFAYIPPGSGQLIGVVSVRLFAADAPFDEVVDTFARRSSPRLTAPVDEADFAAPGLGEGRRVVRFEFTGDDLQAIYVTVGYLWRSGDVDLVVSYTSFDITAALVMSAAAENWLGGFSFERAA